MRGGAEHLLQRRPNPVYAWRRRHTNSANGGFATDPIAPAGHWNVAQAKCRAVLGVSDDDRAVIGMFYYGYLSAKLNFTVIDTSRIEGDLRHVFETCWDYPDMTIVDAFRTLRPKRQ